MGWVRTVGGKNEWIKEEEKTKKAMVRWSWWDPEKKKVRSLKNKNQSMEVMERRVAGKNGEEWNSLINRVV